MKKAILTIGLFSLVMVLTSFTAAETNIQSGNNVNGSVSIGDDKKMDATVEVFKTENAKLEIIGNGGSGSVGSDKKND